MRKRVNLWLTLRLLARRATSILYEAATCMTKEESKRNMSASAQNPFRSRRLCGLHGTIYDLPSVFQVPVWGNITQFSNYETRGLDPRDARDTGCP